MFLYAHIRKTVVLALALVLCSATARAADVVETVRQEGSLGTFARALDAADLAEALAGEGPFTVFAPTDEAFDDLPQEMADRLLATEDKEQLRAVLGYHVVQGQEIASSGVQTDVVLFKTMQGDDLAIQATGGKMTVSPAAADYVGAPPASVAEADIRADNGTVHVIDTVLLPPEVQKTLVPQEREQLTR